MSEKKHLALYCGDFTQYGLTYNGIELANRLGERGYQVYLLTPQEGMSAEKGQPLSNVENFVQTLPLSQAQDQEITCVINYAGETGEMEKSLLGIGADHYVSWYWGQDASEAERLAETYEAVLCNKSAVSSCVQNEKVRYTQPVVSLVQAQSWQQQATDLCSTLGDKTYYIENMEKDFSVVRAKGMFEVDPKKVKFLVKGEQIPYAMIRGIIQGFSKFHREYPASHLYLEGQPVLYQKIEQLIEQLRLEDGVTQLVHVEGLDAFAKLCSAVILAPKSSMQAGIFQDAEALGVMFCPSAPKTGDWDGRILFHMTDKEVARLMEEYVQKTLPSWFYFDANDYNQNALDDIIKTLEKLGVS